MTLKILSREDYEQVSATFKERSFMQSVEMADLLEKRGFDITFLGLEADGAIQVAGVLYSMPMTGGLHMEINRCNHKFAFITKTIVKSFIII